MILITGYTNNQEINKSFQILGLGAWFDCSILCNLIAQQINNKVFETFM